jgi:hypothetical protein
VFKKAQAAFSVQTNLSAKLRSLPSNWALRTENEGNMMENQHFLIVFFGMFLVLLR